MEPVSRITRRHGKVQSAIDQDQHRRALIVNVAQGVAALHLLLVFLLAKGPVSLFKHPVSALFVVYGGFLAYSVVRARRKTLKPWDIGVGIALDLALVLEVMFYQYARADLSLATAPLFSYVFLFIAMRCLHFTPVYVWAAGGAAMVGWGVLTFVTLADAGFLAKGMLKGLNLRDLMLSGIIDRALAITAVTVVLAICIREARRYFEMSVIRGIAGQGLAKFLSEDVAARILLTENELKPGQGRARKAAILMMDIRDFTNIATAMSPTDVMSLLNEYHAQIVPVIVEHGGCIDKFMGDGILAHFGAAVASKTYAADGLRAVEAMLYRWEIWSEARRAKGLPALDFGIACATGDVIFGTVGGIGKMEFTTIGDAVNMTAKLEKHTKALKARALVTGAAFDAALGQGFQPQYLVTRFDAQQIPGMNQAVDVVVMGEKEGAARPRTIPPGSRPGAA